MKISRQILICFALTLIAQGSISAQRPEPVPQIGHSDGVSCTAVSPDNQLLVSADQSGTIKLWHTQGFLLRTIAAHDGVITAVEFNADGDVFASESVPGFSRADGAGGGMDGTVKLWEVRTGKLLVKLDFAAPQLAHFAFSPDGDLLASGAKDNTIKIWDAHSGRLLQTLVGHTRGVGDVVFSPDGKFIASANKYGLDDGVEQPCEASNPKDQARLWNLKTGKPIVLQGCRSVYFSPTGMLAADDKGNVYETNSGRLLNGLGGDFFAFSRDEARAVLSDKQQFSLVEVRTGKLIRRIKGSREQGVVINGLTLLVGSEKNFEGWDLTDGRLLYHVDGYQVDTIIPGGDRLVASRTGNELESVFFDTRSGQRLRSVSKDIQDSGYTSVTAFSPNGQLMVTSDDLSLKLVETASGQLRRSFRNSDLAVIALTYSPDKKTLAVSRNERYELWDMQSGNLVRTFAVRNGIQDGIYNEFGFTPDGQLFDTGDGQVWNVHNGILVSTFAGNVVLGSEVHVVVTPEHLEVRDSRTNALRRQIEVSGDPKIALSPNGKLLAVGKDFPGTGAAVIVAMIYDLETGRVRSLRGRGRGGSFVTKMLFSPDGGKVVVTTNLTNAGSVANFLFDVRTGALLTDFDLNSTGSIRDEGIVYGPVLAFSPDGKMVVMASRDANKIEFRALPSGKRIKMLTVATSTQYFSALGRSAAFSPDGKVLATGESDSEVKFWSVATGELLATMLSSTDGNWLVVAPDGLFDGSPNGWSQMLWRFGGDTYNVAPAEIYFNEFYYPGLLSDIFAGNRPKAIQNIAQKDRRQPKVEIELTSPQPSAAEITTRTINVRVKINEAAADKDHPQGSGALDVRLFRNGSLVKVWKGDVLKGSESIALEAAGVPIVAGTNRFQAYAFNRDNIKSANAELLVNGANQLRRKGVAYVLAIGINKYHNPQFNLNYAVADAQAFGVEFKRQQEGLGIYQDVQVGMLLDQDATKTLILQALQLVSNRAQPEDAVIIYFAGHGTASDNRFYLMPNDITYGGQRDAITTEALDPILAQSISDVELQQAFEKMDAGHILFIIDACNSGQALEDEEKRRGPMNSKGLAQLAYEKGMYILAAAQSYQAALEFGQLGHGLLTYTLVEEGLKTPAADLEPKDGELRVREWLNYATQRVPKMQEEKLKTRAARSSLAGAVEGKQKFARQRPRVFYRRELDAGSFIVAKTSATQRK